MTNAHRGSAIKVQANGMVTEEEKRRLRPASSRITPQREIRCLVFAAVVVPLVRVLVGISYHTCNKHEPVPALLDKVRSQQSEKVGLCTLRFPSRLLLESIQLALQASDIRK
jgi:hypothetical protein